MEFNQALTEKIRCAHCQGAVMMTFEGLPRRPLPSRMQPWICPYCFRKNEDAFPALLKSVMKRVGA